MTARGCEDCSQIQHQVNKEVTTGFKWLTIIQDNTNENVTLFGNYIW